MATTEKTKNTLKGGEFLIKETPAENVFIPEELDKADLKWLREL